MHFYTSNKKFKCKIEVPGLNFNSYHIIDNIHRCIKFLKRVKFMIRNLWLTRILASFRVMVMMMMTMMIVPVSFLSSTQTRVI